MPDGIFLTVTHSKHSLKEVTRYVPRCMEMVGIEPPSEIAINRLFQSFCLEDGEEKLAPYFGRVERIVYLNDLLFPLDRVMECISYLDKKRYLIMKDVSENYPHKLEVCYGISTRWCVIMHVCTERSSLPRMMRYFRCSLPRERGL